MRRSFSAEVESACRLRPLYVDQGFGGGDATEKQWWD